MAWAVEILFYLVIKLADIFAGSIGDVMGNLVSLKSFITQVRTGQMIFAQAIAGFVIAIWAQWARTRIGFRVLTLFTVISLLPPALTGHSGALSLHQIAITSWGVHILAISLWCAGVGALVYTGLIHPDRIFVVGMKFSRLALFCFVATIISGVVNSYVRISFMSNLFSSTYGQLLLMKILITVTLGILGSYYRRRLFAERRRTELFLRLVSFELFLMALAVMLGVVLSGTAFPRPI